MRVSGVGIWSSQLRYGDPAEAADAAAELEELGYGALWIPDGGGPVIEAVEQLLAATSEMVVATGVLNLWMHTPAEVAAGFTRLTAAHGPRFLLGIGVGHAPQLAPGEYRHPLAAMTTFLDGLDQADSPVPVESRVLAALGPKMLDVAGRRSAGVHPYLVTPEATAMARAALGPGVMVLPEHAAILCAGRETAREIGDPWLERYLRLPNYTNNLLRLGFTQDDIDTASDRLFDGVIAWGDEDVIRRRIDEHTAAGADQVALQALSASQGFPREDWRRLAAALL